MCPVLHPSSTPCLFPRHTRVTRRGGGPCWPWAQQPAASCGAVGQHRVAWGSTPESFLQRKAWMLLEHWSSPPPHVNVSLQHICGGMRSAFSPVGVADPHQPGAPAPRWSPAPSPVSLLALRGCRLCLPVCPAACGLRDPLSLSLMFQMQASWVGRRALYGLMKHRVANNVSQLRKQRTIHWRSLGNWFQYFRKKRKIKSFPLCPHKLYMV